jgi:uncharacterized protein YecT (DUF1311 family)
MSCKYGFWGRPVAAALGGLGALAVLAAPGVAQESPDEGVRDALTEEQAAQDVAFLRECLETLAARGAPARVCIDIVARDCVSEPGGETSAGALACEERESNAWQALLDEAAGELDRGMSNTERERFAAAQDAWGAYRDAQCAYEGAQLEDEDQPTVERASCVRRLTAERTIGMHERDAEVEERAGPR